MKLIVGLGNPGQEYSKTRHNVGFMAIDSIASENKILINKSKFGGLYNVINIRGEKVVLLKPQKYINLSGEVIREFASFYKLDINDILIIHDDLDTKSGQYKLKYKGGSGGHNGLKDIERIFNNNNYKRLKIGISNNKNVDTKDYVLSSFSKEEELLITSVINKINDIFYDYLILDFEKLMSKYNIPSDTK